MNRFYPWPLPFTQAIAALLIGAILSLSSCAFFQGETPSVVQAQTAGVISATRIAVLTAGTAAEATLNAYIDACHKFLVVLAAGIQAGTAVLPTPDVIHQDLINLAASIGSPQWALNMAGNLWVTYQRFYNTIGANSPKVYAYVNAFALATV